jgi:hypothetical protein
VLDRVAHIVSGECKRLARGEFDERTSQFRRDYAKWHDRVRSIEDAISVLVDKHQYDAQANVAALAYFVSGKSAMRRFVAEVAPRLKRKRLFELLFNAVNEAPALQDYARELSRKQVELLVQCGAPTYRDYTPTRVSLYDACGCAQPPEDDLTHYDAPAVGNALTGGSVMLLATVLGRADLFEPLSHAVDSTWDHIHEDLHTQNAHIYALCNDSAKLRRVTVGHLLARDRDALTPLHYAARGNALECYRFIEGLAVHQANLELIVGETLLQALQFGSVEVARYITQKYIHRMRTTVLPYLDLHCAYTPSILDTLLATRLVFTQEDTCSELFIKLCSANNVRGVHTLLQYVRATQPYIDVREFVSNERVCEAIVNPLVYDHDALIGIIHLISYACPDSEVFYMQLLRRAVLNGLPLLVAYLVARSAQLGHGYSQGVLNVVLEDAIMARHNEVINVLRRRGAVIDENREKELLARVSDKSRESAHSKTIVLCHGVRM